MISSSAPVGAGELRQVGGDLLGVADGGVGEHLVDGRGPAAIRGSASTSSSVRRPSAAAEDARARIRRVDLQLLGGALRRLGGDHADAGDHVGLGQLRRGLELSR